MILKSSERTSSIRLRGVRRMRKPVRMRRRAALRPGGPLRRAVVEAGAAAVAPAPAVRAARAAAGHVQDRRAAPQRPRPACLLLHRGVGLPRLRAPALLLDIHIYYDVVKPYYDVGRYAGR